MVDIKFLNEYAADVCGRINEILNINDVKLIATVYKIENDSPFDVVRFEQVAIDTKRKQVTNAHVKDHSVICAELPEHLQKQIETDKFMMVYMPHMMYVMKPPVTRFWSPHAARRDTEQIINDHMNAPHEPPKPQPKTRAKPLLETSKHATKKRPSRRTRNTQITAHPVIYNDQTYIWIDGFENVKSVDNLPEEYLRGTPSYYQSDEGNVCVSSGKRPTVFRVGSTYPVARFDEIVDTMKAAGERFTAIRRRAAFVVEI